MRTFWLVLINISLATTLLGCRPAVKIESESSYYTDIVILQGSGSGRYLVGSTVHVWADPYQPGFIFDTWKGDIDALSDARAFHATLIVPANGVRLSATYKQMPLWSASFQRIANRDTYIFLPKHPKGVIFFFHGSGGDAREWTNLGMERGHFFDEAIAEGYAILAVNSADTINKQWNVDLPPNPNPDVDAVRTILAEFVTSGQITTDTPLFAVGFSQGGQFASLVAYVLGMDAVAIWCGDGLEAITKASTVPTIWCLAEHDPIIDNEQAQVYYEYLVSRGIDANFYIHPPSPLYPLYFTHIQGIEATESQWLFTQLKTKGYLDTNDYLTENPRLSLWDKHIGLNLPEEIRDDLRDHLFVAYSEHAFYSDCDHRVLDFFEAHR
ncbi:MAG: dienelactone hydrolase family protein [Chloroflexi bacterium]|nr:dienelactone hydrolase family protein [Chloroflexota bacterium]